MRNGPVKIVLIQAGKYDYAEVDLDGAVQIVGGNNVGKTTLINTLPFLYVDDRSKMSFGRYSLDETLEYYFRSQYSYVLFECRTLRGQAVVGWRGSSPQSDAGPQRFWYLGPYRREDFFSETGCVREPLDVSATLSSLRDLQLTPKPQQHREVLLAGAGERGAGLGIVSLKDNDKFYHFRETLKNLLMLKDISQEQMRDSLLMLADIPTDQPALEKRVVLGDDHDRLVNWRQELQRFKQHEAVIKGLLEKFETCQQVRCELMYRWTILKQQKEAFEVAHQTSIVGIDGQIAEAVTQQETSAATVTTKREEHDKLIAKRTTLENLLAPLPKLAKQFAGFAEELEHAALATLEKHVVEKQALLREAATEKLTDVEEKLEEATTKITTKQQSIQQFGQLVVTALRKEFNDEKLGRIFAILSPELLESPLGRNGITSSDPTGAVTKLRQLLKRTQEGIYQDDLLTIRFKPASAALAKLQSVEKLETELNQWQKEKVRLEKLKDAVVQRAHHAQQLDVLVDQKKKQAQRIHEYGQFKAAKESETDWRKQLGEAQGAIGALAKTITELESAAKQALEKQATLANLRKEEARQHNEVRLRFDKCLRPIFDEGSPRAGAEIPSEFDSAVSFYLSEQSRESTLAQELRTLLLQIQGFFGDRYNGATEGETIRKLREEMDGASEKEKFLQHDWDAHIQGLKTRFKQVLDDLGHIQAAATRLTSAFKQVPVSDLKAIKLTIDPNPDIVSIIKRLAGLEELALWADQSPLETALQRVRELLDKNPIIRLSELFTLGVSVTGADNTVKHYHDLSQVESDGTTVTVKVLFNLLVLKSQLRKDDVALPFFLDELDRLDADNCRAVLRTAKALGFIAITAAPRPVGEVDACLFLERHPSGRVKLTSKHRLDLRPKSVPAKPE